MDISMDDLENLNNHLGKRIQLVPLAFSFITEKEVTYLGTAIAPTPFGEQIMHLVEFDNPLEFGHDGGPIGKSVGFTGKPGHCWWVYSEQLALLQKEK